MTDSPGEAVRTGSSNATSIAYEDGGEAEVRRLIDEATGLSSLAAIGAGDYGRWPVRSHLCPQRGTLLRPFRFEGLTVLELGAGLGGVSRVLAESAAHLTVVEGVASRLDACRARLRDLSNWDGHLANIQGFETERRYDVVCLIGVLEYAAMYVAADGARSPFDVVLTKAASLCKPDGVVILAIENQLGLKYWTGASEDHLGRRFHGLAGYPAGPGPRTFSRRELQRLLRANGLAAVRQFFPFPDYKVPHAIVSEALIDASPALAAELAGSAEAEDYVLPRLSLVPDALAARTVAEAGLLKDLANSFLFLCTKAADSPTLRRLCGAMEERELGWHYSLWRVQPTVTTFHSGASGVEVSKRPLVPGARPVHAGLDWHEEAQAPVARDPALMSVLRRHAYYGDWTGFEALFTRFLEWSFGKWSVAEPAMLSGRAIDAGVTNAVVTAEGFSLFDLEWGLHREMPRSCFILRNLILLAVIDAAPDAPFPYASLAALYESLCERLRITPALADDLDRETDFQLAACGGTDRQGLRDGLGRNMARPLKPLMNETTLARLQFEPALQAVQADRDALRAHVTAVEADRDILRARLDALEAERRTLGYAIGFKAGRILRRLPFLESLYRRRRG